MRLPSYKAAAQQRSINLAISSRGIAALQAIEPGAGDRFLAAAIPMHARMVHDPKGKLSSLPYDRNGQVRLVFLAPSSPINNIPLPPSPTHTNIY